LDLIYGYWEGGPIKVLRLRDILIFCTLFTPSFPWFQNHIDSELRGRASLIIVSVVVYQTKKYLSCFFVSISFNQFSEPVTNSSCPAPIYIYRVILGCAGLQEDICLKRQLDPDFSKGSGSYNLTTSYKILINTTYSTKQKNYKKMYLLMIYLLGIYCSRVVYITSRNITQIDM